MPTPPRTPGATPQFFDGYGNLLGPGLSAVEATALPADVQLPGIVVDRESTPA